jgi:uncharacterized protein YkuJ
MTTKRKTDGEEVVEATFTKEQLLLSKKYFDKQDLINVILKDGESYSFDHVDDLIEEFMKGEVN